jgi:hypothetical protein
MSIKMLTSGGQEKTTAPGGASVIGSVASAGSVLVGLGFTAVRNSAGKYTVTFNTPFPSTPIVVANSLGFPSLVASVNAVSTTSCDIWVANSSTGTFTDSPFDFIASLTATFSPPSLPAMLIGTELAYNQITADKPFIGQNEAQEVDIIVGSTFASDGSRVKVECWAPAIAGNGNMYWGVLHRDGPIIGQWQMGRGFSTQDSPANTLIFYDTPSVGNHQYTWKAFGADAGGIVRAGPGSGSGTRLPAFMRVTKAA